MSGETKRPDVPEHEQADPFGERLRPPLARRCELLGSEFEFRSHSPALMALVDEAYAGLPPQRLAGRATGPRLQIELRLDEHGDAFAGRTEPPEARMQGGAGFFCALMDAANFAIVHPAQGSAVVGISRTLLERFRYHARYELLEFAVFLLASRSQQLVPLHAACIGLHGKGLLLLGESGAGKSTLALQCLQLGLDFLTEDAAFVAADSLQAVGVANFLHLRSDGLALVGDEGVEAQVRASPVIRRRSGVEKFELDLRQPWARLAPQPLRLTGLVFLSREAAAPGGQGLTPLALADWLPRFMKTQAYATQQAGWAVFEPQLRRLPACEMKRGAHPREAAQALRRLLEP